MKGLNSLLFLIYILSVVQEPPGDILVFLTGQDDIDVAVKLLTEEARSDGKSSSGNPLLVSRCSF